MRERHLIMGVLNLTPDSFSDGGRYVDPGAAFAQAELLAAEGADILDLGAESTRPGAAPVDAAEEWRRLGPVLARLGQARLPVRLSVDTYKPDVMRRALDAGVTIINDVKGAADAETLAAIARHGATWIAMHMRADDPRVMQRSPLTAPEALAAVAAFYDECARRAGAAGLPADRVWFDPGIGFGKTPSANLRLIQASLAAAAERPIVLGVSRKSFIGHLLGIPDPKDRDDATKMLEASFLFAPVTAIRTHAVAKLAKIKACLYAETTAIAAAERP